MKRFLHHMPEMLRTAAAFLLILSCMVSASVASVRAEEQMENQNVIENERLKTETSEESDKNIKDETGGETTGELPGIASDIPGDESSFDQTAPAGDGDTEKKSMPAQDTDQPEEPKAEPEDSLEASDTVRIPAGRIVSGNYGTAYVIGANSRMMRSAVNSNCTITPGTIHAYGNWTTSEFYVATDKGHYMGYCAQPNKPTPSGIYQVSELNNDRIKMALMFGQDGPWAGEASTMFGGVANPYPYIHAMIGIEYTGETDGLTEQQIQAMRNALNEQMNSGKAELSIFKEYKAYVAYNDAQDIVWLEYEGPVNGTMILRKASSAPDMTNGNSCYALSGAEYGIYADASCTTRSGLVTTGESGESGLLELAEGDYWVKELTAPRGYLKNTQIYPIHVKAGENTMVDVSDIPEYDPAGLELVKRDQDVQDIVPPEGASLAGAQFTVRYYKGFYENENLPQTPERIWVLETKEVPDPSGAPTEYQALLRDEYKVSGDAFYTIDGKPVLPLGTISIEETKAPEGYMTEGAYLQAEGSTKKITGPYITQVTQTANGASLKGGNQYSIYDQVIRGGVKIRKRDFDTGAAVAQGGAVLENAVFGIVNINENAVFVDGKAYARNEAVATIRTDETGMAQTPDRLLPYGKYRIIETGAPAGYLEKGVLSREFFITKDGETVDLTDTEHSIQNRVKRGDFELRKIDSNTQNVMPGVRFSLTSTTTGETHQITTDENGYYSSSSDWNKHTDNTNQGGKEDGLWFGTDGEGNSAPVDNGLGALPYDTYILEELPSEANEGKEMLKIPFVIYKNQVTVNLGNLENKDLAEETPVISTSARNDATGNHYAQSGSVTVIDSVLYGGLKEKQEYLLKCIPMDKETRKPLADPQGNPIVAEHSFTAAASAGMVEIECTFDASELAGKDIVLYEELYYKENKIAEHKDINDEGQTIHFPEIGTKVSDKSSGSNMVVAEQRVSIVDTVSYKNLKPDQEYTLRGKLMDKETGMIAKDASGGDITAEVTFTPKEKTGKAEVIFNFDGTNLEGKTLVAFETLEKNSKIYAVHADMDSEEQTIYFPKVRTSARDVRTNSRNAQPAEETVVVDSIFYANLTPGQEYTVEGTLMDKETESPLLENGEQINAETTFTPESDSGTVEVTFSFDSSALAGKTAVAFESVTQEGEEVAAHKDIHYEGQTIYFPEIKTSAGEKQSGSQKITAQKEITITDKVTYKNLIPGEQYTVKGILMDKSTGTPFLIEEKELTAEKSFVPDQADGTVEVDFTLNAAAIQNTELVAFEKLFIGETEIASHEDLTDKNQTVQINTPEDLVEEPPVLSTPENPVKTGDPTGILPAVLLFFASLLVLITAARRKLG